MTNLGSVAEPDGDVPEHHSVIGSRRGPAHGRCLHPSEDFKVRSYRFCCARLVGAKETIGSAVLVVVRCPFYGWDIGLIGDGFTTKGSATGSNSHAWSFSVSASPVLVWLAARIVAECWCPRPCFHGGGRSHDGISACIDARPPKLSGGELRRADVAAALVRRPRCLLADEPLRGIAPIDAEALMHAFRAMARAGCAVVVTGHDVETLLDGADHITWSTSGTTYEIGTPEMARHHEGLRVGYLGR